MKKSLLVVTALFFCATLSSCASSDSIKKGEADAKKPVNCATAEGDIRVLMNEKTHASEQLAAGVTAIIPVSLVIGVATGTEGSKAKVATGDYNEMLDKKIAEIKFQCDMK